MHLGPRPAQALFALPLHGGLGAEAVLELQLQPERVAFLRVEYQRHEIEGGLRGWGGSPSTFDKKARPA